MGITGDQAASVKATWKAVAPDAQKHGIAIFVNFLGAHPDQQAFFKKFAKVPHGSLSGNADVAKQASSVMTQLGKYIDVIDNAGALKSAAKPMADSHKTMGVLLANFQKIFPCIIDYIVANAGGDKAAWTAALDTLGAAISSQQ